MKAGCWLSAAVFVVGCAQDINIADGGTDLGVSDLGTVVDLGSKAPDTGTEDASMMGNRDLGTSADAATTDGGMTSKDAEPADTGMAPQTPVSFGEFGLPNDTDTIFAIHGRSANDFFIGTFGGKVMRIQNYGAPEVVWRSPSNFGIRALKVAGSKLYVADEGSLHILDANAPKTGPEREITGFRQVRGMRDLEIDERGNGWVIAQQTNGRALIRIENDAVGREVKPTDVSTLNDIYLVGDTVHVAGNWGIYRFAQNTWTKDTIQWPSTIPEGNRPAYEFHSFAQIGGKLYAFGDRGLVFENNGSSWAVAHDTGHTEAVLRVAASAPRGPAEAYVAGRAGRSGGLIRTYFKGQWQEHSYGGFLSIRAAWSPEPGVFWLGGAQRNTFTGVLLRGSR